jgi:hypothetical protein
VNRNRAAQAIAARPPDKLPERMLEDDFQAIVMAYAQRNEWRVVHIRPARVLEPGHQQTHYAAQRDEPRHVYRTPYEGDPGLPDLILARAGVVLLVELKSRNGRPTTDQTKWLKAAGVNGRLWTPNDWPEIRLELAALVTA